MMFKERPRLDGHLALAFVGELSRGLLQRNPFRLSHFVLHFGRNFADFSLQIPKKVETHNLENAGAITPGSGVDVTDIAQFRQ